MTYSQPSRPRQSQRMKLLSRDIEAVQQQAIRQARNEKVQGKRTASIGLTRTSLFRLPTTGTL